MIAKLVPSCVFFWRAIWGSIVSYTGMGKATAKELARRKARVIIACCDLKEADQAARDIFAETKVDAIVKYLDLASFESVRSFAQDVIATEPRLDVLINNAGIMLGELGSYYI